MPYLLAVEILPDARTENIALQHIETFKADEIKYAIKNHISPKAVIKTDAYHSYKKISKEMSNITMS